MHYSFRNTLCSLAVLVAAGLLAETANAQGTVTLLADEEDEISLAPDAGNLKVNEAGTYAVTLNLAKTPNTILVEKK